MQKCFSIPYLLFSILYAISNTIVAQSSSVLSEGKWLKIGVVSSGIYVIQGSDLSKQGFDLNTIDPQTIQLYGNGGAMLPQNNATTRPQDLTQNAIWIDGETDGRWNVQDKLYFYGESPHQVYIDKTTQRFRHETNIYSDTTYYFLTIGSTKGLRVANAPQLETVPKKVINTYNDFFFHEIDTRNLLNSYPFAGSGREWLGEDFNNIQTNRSFSLPLSNLVANAPVYITSAVVGASLGITSFQLSLNGNVLGSHDLGGISSDRYDVKGLQDRKTFTLTLPEGTANMALSYLFNTNAVSGAVGYLDYFEIQTQRQLVAQADPLVFRSIESQAFKNVVYQIQNISSSARVWNISDAQHPINQTIVLSNTTGAVSVQQDSLQTFVLFDTNKPLMPSSIRQIEQQNIHAITTPNLLIITAPKFLSEAKRLADFRTQHDGLRVAVATTEQIYNEFGSGQLDVSAIRDFVRYVYRQKPIELKYLLLMGDAKFDYKNRLSVLTAASVPDYVPVYESRESLSPIYSYSSDDYYGFMDENEGEWTESYAGDHTLEVGVGRLPVKTLEEAKQVVDKLIRYEASITTGNWKQNLSFVADDGDYNIHEGDADYLAEYVKQQYSAYLPQKIYVDAYPQTIVSSGQKAPQVNTLIREAMNNSLIVNYTGHGGEAGWAEEQILTFADISKWNNTNHLPLMVTATCQFGRYDDPHQLSGAELAILKPNGGAIGLLTTTRPVFANTNFLLNNAFYHAVFELENGQAPRLGDVMRKTKNNSLSGRINRNFSLLGDPSMRLAYPPQKAEIITINQHIAGNDTLKALQKIAFTGRVSNVMGETDAHFNGKVYYAVFDKENTIKTLGNESAVTTFKQSKGALHKGIATVKNGIFTTNFTIPKDINYAFGKGKISLYALSDNQQTEAIGGNIYIVIGGSQANIAIDNKPPTLVAYMDTITFQNGDITLPNTTLYVQLADESGINISPNGIGHQIVATLNDTLRLDISEYWRPIADDPTKGLIQYDFKKIPIGKYSLTINATDVYNNLGSTSLAFKVVENQHPAIWNVQNFPNPVADQTDFWFEHEWEGEDLEVEIKLFDALGRGLAKWQNTIYGATSPCLAMRWQPNFLSIKSDIAKGMYFYRIFVRSYNTQKQGIGSGKLMFVGK
jgi:Peptidase family C25